MSKPKFIVTLSRRELQNKKAKEGLFGIDDLGYVRLMLACAVSTSPQACIPDDFDIVFKEGVKQ